VSAKAQKKLLPSNVVFQVADSLMKTLLLMGEWLQQGSQVHHQTTGKGKECLRCAINSKNERVVKEVRK